MPHQLKKKLLLIGINSELNYSNNGTPTKNKIISNNITWVLFSQLPFELLE